MHPDYFFALEVDDFPVDFLLAALLLVALAFEPGLAFDEVVAELFFAYKINSFVYMKSKNYCLNILP